MISVEEANKKIREMFCRSINSTVPIEDSVGNILSENIYAKRDLPPFHRVAMDGIAINGCLSKHNKTRSFKIQAVQAAGQPPLTLMDGREGCIEIMTGAILPNNSDMVIPYENIEIDNGTASIKSNDELFKPLRNVHPQGSDLGKGALLLGKGKRINSTIVGILASEGLSSVSVLNNPKIDIVSTGSELVSIDQQPEPYQIHMSNNYSLKAELNAFGFKKTQYHHIPDEKSVLYSKLSSIIDESDLILLTGGVSKGKFDFVPEVLEALNIEKIFHKVTQKPGMPLWFGVGENKLVIGLPGNPVSALINLRKYVIANLMDETPIKIRLSEAVVFRKKMTLFQPCQVEYGDQGYWATPLIGNGSGDYLSLRRSDGFIELPCRESAYSIGELFSYYPWGKLCC